MTGDLLKFNEDELIFLDVETVRNQEKLEPGTKLWETFRWKNRVRDRFDALPTESETALLYEQKGALDPVYGKIVCITVGAISKGKIFLRTYKGEEKEMLRTFVDMVNENQNKTLVIWNAPFDMPFIRKRFMINKMKDYLSDQCGNDSMKKPWTLKGILDLMDVWKGTSYLTSSLDEVAHVMGLPSPKTDLKGSEVSKAYYEGRIDDIVTYCEKDVHTLINLYRIFTYKDIIEDYTVLTTEPAPAKEFNILEKIFNRGRMTDEDHEPLITLIEKMTVKDKQYASDILNAVTKGEIDKPVLTALNKKRKTSTRKKKTTTQKTTANA